MPPPLSVKRTPTFSELIEGGAPVAAPATSPARLPPPTGAPTFADLIGGAATPSPQGSVAPSPQAGPAPIAPELPLPPADDPGKIPPLQVYSDVADVLPNLGVSFFESPGEPWEPQAWKQSFGDVSRAYRILHEQGPHALNEEYNATSTPHLERTAPYNPWSRAELKYPAVRAGTSFASETVNPSNVLLPLGVGLVGKGLGWAGRGVRAASKAQQGGRAANETPTLFRSQRSPGEAEISPRGGTFWGLHPGYADMYNVAGKNTGGAFRVEHVAQPKNPLRVSTGSKPFNPDAPAYIEDRPLRDEALAKMLGNARADELDGLLEAAAQEWEPGHTFQDVREKILAPYGVPGDEQKALKRVDAVLDRVAAEEARKRGYDAIVSEREFFSLTPNATRAPMPVSKGSALRDLAIKAASIGVNTADAVGDFVVGPFDRFRGVRKVGGKEGEHVAREMVGNTAKAATEALDKAHSVFGPVRQAEKPGFMGHVQRVRGALWPHSYLSREEKIEIVRRSQGLVPKHVVNKNIPVDVPPARRFTLPNANPSEKDALGYLRQAGYAEEDAQQLVNDAARNPKREQFGPTIARAANAQLQKTRQADVAASKAAAMTDAEQARDALLTERAKALRTTLKGMDWKQINAHPELLAADRVFDPEKFFPMAGQYRDKNLTDEAAQFLEDRRPVGGGGSLKTVKGTAGGTVHKTHMDMDDALRGGNLKADFDPAQSLYAFLARRGKNVAFEEGIQKLPDSLAKRVEYERSSLGAGQSNIQQYLKIGDFTHWGPLAEKKFAQATAGMHKVTPPDHFGAKAVQDVLGSSPSAAQRTFHPEAVKFIQEAGATKPEADNVTKFIEAINNLTRIGIITNPVVHVGWNLFGNYLGAKGDPARLGYIASGKGWSEAGKWEKLSDQYGGQAHFTPQGIAGGEVARLATGGGNPVERFGTRLWSANQRFVFDTFEKRFAAALMHDKFQEAQKAGMQEVDALRHAGIEVRKALGDYANVHPAGIEGFLNRALFFYPWLHTIIPFSVKTAANNPSWITKPQRAVQSWNQGMGAPDATKSNQISLGFDDNGNPRMLPLPFVQRNLENVYNVVGPGQGTPTDRTKAFLDVLGTHATPPLSALIDAAATNFAKPTAPGQGNYHILWDKAAPAPEQWRQGAVNFGARFVPPMLKNVPSFASVLGGTPYTRLSPGRARVSAKERDTMLRLINLANKAHNPEAAAAIYKAYTEQVQPAIQGR